MGASESSLWLGPIPHPHAGPHHEGVDEFVVVPALLHEGPHLTPEGLRFARQHLVPGPQALRPLSQLFQLSLQAVPLTRKFLEAEKYGPGRGLSGPSSTAGPSLLLMGRPRVERGLAEGHGASQ